MYKIFYMLCYFKCKWYRGYSL